MKLSGQLGTRVMDAAQGFCLLGERTQSLSFAQARALGEHV